MLITEEMRRHKLKNAFGCFLVCTLCGIGIWFGFFVKSEMNLLAFFLWELMCGLLFLIAFFGWILYLRIILKKI